MYFVVDKMMRSCHTRPTFARHWLARANHRQENGLEMVGFNPRGGGGGGGNQLLAVMWNAFSHSVALFPSSNTNWMTLSAAFGSCFNSMVTLRIACDLCGPCLKRHKNILSHVCRSVSRQPAPQFFRNFS